MARAQSDEGGSRGDSAIRIEKWRSLRDSALIHEVGIRRLLWRAWRQSKRLRVGCGAQIGWCAPAVSRHCRNTKTLDKGSALAIGAPRRLVAGKQCIH